MGFSNMNYTLNLTIYFVVHIPTCIYIKRGLIGRYTCFIQRYVYICKLVSKNAVFICQKRSEGLFCCVQRIRLFVFGLTTHSSIQHAVS